MGGTHAMTRLSVFIASSIDGYIATPDGGLEWLEGAARADEDYGYDGFLASVDGLAMGRGTYEHIAHIDPLPFGGRPVFVFTHRPVAARDGVVTWDRSPQEAARAWADLGLTRVYVDGGQLISAFLAEGLIDDMVLMTAPVVLGQGRPLFHPFARTFGLKLDGVQTWPSGFVSRSYSR
ncbi:MAG: dihydrofolate reductase family protein [Candidatus Nanopelagicales bacterium]